MIDYLARRYGIAPIDYDHRTTHGLLISAGTGLMLSVMDQAPRLRWCLDYDGLRCSAARFSDWLRCAANVTDLIAITGWFSATNPKTLVAGLAALGRRVPLYVQYFGPPPDPFATLRTACDLGEFIAQVNGWPGRREILAKKMGASEEAPGVV